MSFLQAPPQLGNQYRDDRVLRSYLHRALPPEALAEIEPSLDEMGELAGGELYEMQLADRLNEPLLIQWDAWGRRVDRIEPTPLWRRAEHLAAVKGLVAAAYERALGSLSRIHQFALAYLFTPSTDIYACPLAMTDGAAKTLLVSGNQALIQRAVPRLTSRDPERFWTSGQWMTETTGGSDVGLSETVAVLEKALGWRLYGRKWFTSAAASQMALTLARPEGNAPGGRGLALFYLETRDEEGRLRNIRIDRLKDKLGTRKLPTAELTLDGAPAQPVYGTTDGVRNIATMLNITRTWNGVSAVSLMRRGLALARDYAGKRVAFGAALAEKPLHLETLAGLQAEFEGAFHLCFRVVELLGREETGELVEHEGPLLRILTPIMKLLTGKQVVAVTSEVLECFGGAGYVEDTGLPMLLRDAQVLPLWEGTTNVLALDALRAVGKEGGLEPLRRELGRLEATLQEESLRIAVEWVSSAIAGAERWWQQAAGEDPEELEAGGRRFAMALGRAMEIALLASHAQWSLEIEGDERGAAAARRLARHGIEPVGSTDRRGARLLARDEPAEPRAVATRQKARLGAGDD